MQSHLSRAGIRQGFGLGLAAGLVLGSPTLHAQGSYAAPQTPGFATGPLLTPPGETTNLDVPTTAWQTFEAAPLFSAALIEIEEQAYIIGFYSAPVLQPEDANARYGIPGVLAFESPLPEPVAKLRHDRKLDELKRTEIALREPAGLWSGIAQACVGLVSGILDPVNIVVFLSIGFLSRTWASAMLLGLLGAIGLAALMAAVAANTQLEVGTYGAACMVGVLATWAARKAVASGSATLPGARF